jgi:hypothetical protein
MLISVFFGQIKKAGAGHRPRPTHYSYIAHASTLRPVRGALAKAEEMYSSEVFGCSASEAVIVEIEKKMGVVKIDHTLLAMIFHF